MRPPMLDPKRDLAGATPETLARALFRRVEPPKRSPTRRTGSGQLPMDKTVGKPTGD